MNEMHVTGIFSLHSVDTWVCGGKANSIQTGHTPRLRCPPNVT